MPQLIQGKELLVFFRRYKDRQTVDAGKIRFQTEHTINSEKETESTKTKDGVVNTISDGETSGEFTSLAYREDTDTVNMWHEMRKWFKDGDRVECWQVDLGSKRMQGSKEVYDVDYYQGYLKNFEISAPADGPVELSYELAVDGNGVTGTDTLTESQKKAVATAQYDYQTLAKLSQETGEGV